MLDNLFIMGSLGVVVFLILVLFIQRIYQHPSLQKQESATPEAIEQRQSEFAEEDEEDPADSLR